MTTFLQFIEKVESQIRMPDNDSIRPRLKDIVNETIEEFSRYRHWLRLWTEYEFTTGKSFTIQDLNSVANSVYIQGNIAFKFKKGDEITLVNTLSNDGIWLIESSIYDPTTLLTALKLQSPLDTTDHSIVSIDTGTKIFRIAGDYSAYFTDTKVFAVTGSVANDQDYTVDGDATYDDINDWTIITVLEAISSSDTAGTLHVPQQNVGTISSEHQDYGVPEGFIAEIGMYGSIIRESVLLAK